MRVASFILTALLTVFLVILLNTSWILQAPLAKLLAPQQGLWQNAQPADQDYSAYLSFPNLHGKASVYFDERLVPHVFAESDQDAYFVQGYLHARFRLWQMDFQTYAAAGRLCELVGDKAIDWDRDKRRLGMGYAAEVCQKEMEKDSLTKLSCDYYTAGVNAYIESLTESTLPFEYKLLGYYPEKWTTLKTALLLKYMSLDLAGYEKDFEMTNSKAVFTGSLFDKVYPTTMDSLDPIVPKGTVFDTAGIKVKAPASADSLYYAKKDSVPIIEQKPSKDNGSNNWAVAGTKTKSGAPILCNDPHLGLNLPSLWYEIQISTPDHNVYGASLPGAPSVVIGYNDSCAFGLTNAMRDVRDYYEIKFKDDSRKEYWFNNEWKTTEFRVERIGIKGKPDMLDTVAYTVFGPVMYDKSYSGKRGTNDKYYSVRWKAHDPSNELKTFLLLNKAKNYTEYYTAIQNLHTPGQNCIFAAKNGDIAIWDQGEFPAKWYRQGDFIMPGTDSSYMWQGMIPQAENPHLINPPRGFVSSANQLPVDPTVYPYYLGGSYPVYRGQYINRKLNNMTAITPQDMMALQSDNYNIFAEAAQPLLVSNIDSSKLDGEELKYYNLLKTWDLRNDFSSEGTTVFVNTWDSLQAVVWRDKMKPHTGPLLLPESFALLDGIKKDSAYKPLDDINTPQVETLKDDVTAAFIKACHTLKKINRAGNLEWGKFKDTRIEHLARLDALSRLHLPIGGGINVINATKEQHGPSWRMIVSLTPQTEAYGVYPGGQEGNPGSRFYDNFVDTWAAGKYFPLWLMTASEVNDKRIKWKMTFIKA